MEDDVVKKLGSILMTWKVRYVVVCGNHNDQTETIKRSVKNIILYKNVLVCLKLRCEP